MTLREYLEIARRLNFQTRNATVLVLLYLMSTAFEGIGIGMLLPVVQFIQANGDLQALGAQSRLWQGLIRFYGLAGISVTLASLLTSSFLCIVCRQTVIYIRQFYLAHIRERLIRDTRNLGFQRFLEADIAYHDSQSAGGVVNGLTAELSMAVDSCLAPIQIVGYGVMALSYVGALVFLAGPIAVIAMATIGLPVLLLKDLFGQTNNSGKEVRKANHEMSTFLVDRLRSARLIRLSGTEAAEVKDMTHLTQQQYYNMVKLRTVMARADVLMEPLVVGVGFGLLYVGVVMAGLKIEDIGLFLIVAVRLLPIVKEVMRSYQSMLGYQSSLIALDRRYRTMEAARESKGGDQIFSSLDRGIRLEDVTFQYLGKGTVPALSHVTLEIPAGKTTALVGPSGSGKSTLIDLLPRLRDPVEGTVLFDGQPLARFSIQSLRAGIAYVPQSPQMFNVTVAQHIRYGKPGASDSEIMEAARLANADDFIGALHHGYDTILGENGIRLSGGQRQRLDLARALVCKVPILILDEPTSHLDADAEAKLRDALRHIHETRVITIIIVGHSLASTAGADSVVVLNRGRVESIGTHAMLMTQGGWYAQAFTKQQRAAGGEAPPQIAQGLSPLQAER